METTLTKPTTKIPTYRIRYQLRLTQPQQFAYDLLLRGLNTLSKKEQESLNDDDKRLIIYNQDRAWKIVNRLKTEKMNWLLNLKLKNIFGNSLTGNLVPLLLDPITDNSFQCHVREAEVERDIIIQEFIKQKLLPQEFYSE